MRRSLITLLIAAMLLALAAMPLSALAAEEETDAAAELVVEAAPTEVTASEPAPAQTPEEPSAPAEPEPQPGPAEEDGETPAEPDPAEEETPAPDPAETSEEGEAEPEPEPAPILGATKEIYVIPAGETAEETPAETPPEKPEDRDGENDDIGEPGDYSSIQHVPYGGAVVSPSDADDEYDREENLAVIYDFLTEELELNTAAACGVLANIAEVSDFNPRVTNGRCTSFGLFQWSGGRAAELIRFCEWYGYDFRTLEGQLEFMRYELTGPRQYVLDYLLDLENDAAGAYAAAGYWCYHYQAPLDRAAEAAACGVRAAEEFFPVYAPEEGDASAEAAEAAPETVLPFVSHTSESVRQAFAAQTAAADEDEEEEELFAIDPAVGTGYFILPVAEAGADDYGWRIHPIYGQWRFHSGTDMSANAGDPIYAADNGTVIISGYDANGYGNYVVIDHNDGYQTLYAHQSELAVSAGDVVAQGDVIGYVGATGAATGPHLHYEIWVEYETVDPISYVTSPDFEYTP